MKAALAGGAGVSATLPALRKLLDDESEEVRGMAESHGAPPTR